MQCAIPFRTNGDKYTIPYTCFTRYFIPELNHRPFSLFLGFLSMHGLYPQEVNARPRGSVVFQCDITLNDVPNHYQKILHERYDLLDRMERAEVEAVQKAEKEQQARELAELRKNKKKDKKGNLTGGVGGGNNNNNNNNGGSGGSDEKGDGDMKDDGGKGFDGIDDVVQKVAAQNEAIYASLQAIALPRTTELPTICFYEKNDDDDDNNNNNNNNNNTKKGKKVDKNNKDKNNGENNSNSNSNNSNKNNNDKNNDKNKDKNSEKNRDNRNDRSHRYTSRENDKKDDDESITRITRGKDGPERNRSGLDPQKVNNAKKEPQKDLNYQEFTTIRPDQSNIIISFQDHLFTLYRLPSDKTIIFFDHSFKIPIGGQSISKSFLTAETKTSANRTRWFIHDLYPFLFPLKPRTRDLITHDTSYLEENSIRIDSTPWYTSEWTTQVYLYPSNILHTLPPEFDIDPPVTSTNIITPTTNLTQGTVCLNGHDWPYLTKMSSNIPYQLYGDAGGVDLEFPGTEERVYPDDNGEVEWMFVEKAKRVQVDWNNDDPNENEATYLRDKCITFTNKRGPLAFIERIKNKQNNQNLNHFSESNNRGNFNFFEKRVKNEKKSNFSSNNSQNNFPHFPQVEKEIKPQLHPSISPSTSTTTSTAPDLLETHTQPLNSPPTLTLNDHISITSDLPTPITQLNIDENILELMPGDVSSADLTHLSLDNNVNRKTRISIMHCGQKVTNDDFDVCSLDDFGDLYLPSLHKPTLNTSQQEYMNHIHEEYDWNISFERNLEIGEKNWSDFLEKMRKKSVFSTRYPHYPSITEQPNGHIQPHINNLDPDQFPRSGWNFFSGIKGHNLPSFLPPSQTKQTQRDKNTILPLNNGLNLLSKYFETGNNGNNNNNNNTNINPFILAVSAYHTNPQKKQTAFIDTDNERLVHLSLNYNLPKTVMLEPGHSFVTPLSLGPFPLLDQNHHVNNPVGNVPMHNWNIPPVGTYTHTHFYQRNRAENKIALFQPGKIGKFGGKLKKLDKKLERKNLFKQCYWLRTKWYEQINDGNNDKNKDGSRKDKDGNSSIVYDEKNSFADIYRKAIFENVKKLKNKNKNKNYFFGTRSLFFEKKRIIRHVKEIKYHVRYSIDKSNKNDKRCEYRCLKRVKFPNFDNFFIQNKNGFDKIVSKSDKNNIPQILIPKKFQNIENVQNKIFEKMFKNSSNLIYFDDNYDGYMGGDLMVDLDPDNGYYFRHLGPGIQKKNRDKILLEKIKNRKKRTILDRRNKNENLFKQNKQENKIFIFKYPSSSFGPKLQNLYQSPIYYAQKRNIKTGTFTQHDSHTSLLEMGHNNSERFKNCLFCTKKRYCKNHKKVIKKVIKKTQQNTPIALTEPIPKYPKPLRAGLIPDFDPFSWSPLEDFRSLVRKDYFEILKLEKVANFEHQNEKNGKKNAEMVEMRNNFLNCSDPNPLESYLVNNNHKVVGNGHTMVLGSNGNNGDIKGLNGIQTQSEKNQFFRRNFQQNNRQNNRQNNSPKQFSLNSPFINPNTIQNHTAASFANNSSGTSLFGLNNNNDNNNNNINGLNGKSTIIKKNNNLDQAQISNFQFQHNLMHSIHSSVSSPITTTAPTLSNDSSNSSTNEVFLRQQSEFCLPPPAQKKIDKSVEKNSENLDKDSSNLTTTMIETHTPRFIPHLPPPTLSNERLSGNHLDQIDTKSPEKKFITILQNDSSTILFKKNSKNSKNSPKNSPKKSPKKSTKIYTEEEIAQSTQLESHLSIHHIDFRHPYYNNRSQAVLDEHDEDISILAQKNPISKPKHEKFVKMFIGAPFNPAIYAAINCLESNILQNMPQIVHSNEIIHPSTIFNPNIFLHNTILMGSNEELNNTLVAMTPHHTSLQSFGGNRGSLEGGNNIGECSTLFSPQSFPHFFGSNPGSFTGLFSPILHNNSQQTFGPNGPMSPYNLPNQAGLVSPLLSSSSVMSNQASSPQNFPKDCGGNKFQNNSNFNPNFNPNFQQSNYGNHTSAFQPSHAPSSLPSPIYTAFSPNTSSISYINTGLFEKAEKAERDQNNDKNEQNQFQNQFQNRSFINSSENNHIIIKHQQLPDPTGAFLSHNRSVQDKLVTLLTKKSLNLPQKDPNTLHIPNYLTSIIENDSNALLLASINQMGQSLGEFSKLYSNPLLRFLTNHPSHSIKSILDEGISENILDEVVQELFQDELGAEIENFEKSDDDKNDDKNDDFNFTNFSLESSPVTDNFSLNSEKKGLISNNYGKDSTMGDNNDEDDENDENKGQKISKIMTQKRTECFSNNIQKRKLPNLYQRYHPYLQQERIYPSIQQFYNNYSAELKNKPKWNHYSASRPLSKETNLIYQIFDQNENRFKIDKKKLKIIQKLIKIWLNLGPQNSKKLTKNGNKNKNKKCFKQAKILKELEEKSFMSDDDYDSYPVKKQRLNNGNILQKMNKDDIQENIQTQISPQNFSQTSTQIFPLSETPTPYSIPLTLPTPNTFNNDNESNQVLKVALDLPHNNYDEFKLEKDPQNPQNPQNPHTNEFRNQKVPKIVQNVAFLGLGKILEQQHFTSDVTNTTLYPRQPYGDDFPADPINLLANSAYMMGKIDQNVKKLLENDLEKNDKRLKRLKRLKKMKRLKRLKKFEEDRIGVEIDRNDIDLMGIGRDYINHFIVNNRDSDLNTGIFNHQNTSLNLNTKNVSKTEKTEKTGKNKKTKKTEKNKKQAQLYDPDKANVIHHPRPIFHLPSTTTVLHALANKVLLDNKSLQIERLLNSDILLEKAENEIEKMSFFSQFLTKNDFQLTSKISDSLRGIYDKNIPIDYSILHNDDDIDWGLQQFNNVRLKGTKQIQNSPQNFQPNFQPNSPQFSPEFNFSQKNDQNNPSHTPALSFSNLSFGGTILSQNSTFQLENTRNNDDLNPPAPQNSSTFATFSPNNTVITSTPNLSSNNSISGNNQTSGLFGKKKNKKARGENLRRRREQLSHPAIFGQNGYPFQQVTPGQNSAMQDDGGNNME